MEEREKEMQDARKCATCKEQNEGKGVCGNTKEKLEGEHRDTRDSIKKWVNGET